jgi:GntR family transcriptional regulator
LPAAGPLYLQVRQQILGAIAAGVWPADAAIPAEAALAAHFGVSIGTVRKAVDELVASQVLQRHQGRGTYVTQHNARRLMFHFFHIVGIDGRKDYPQVTTLEFHAARADVAAAALLKIAPSERVFRIRNRLSLSGRDAIVDDITLPAELFPGLTERVFTQRDNTIYHLYQSRFGINVLRTNERLRALPAPADIAAQLGVEPGAPLLRVQRLATTYRDRPVELRMSHVNTGLYEYENTFGKAEGMAS